MNDNKEAVTGRGETIEGLKLSDDQVRSIVAEWYINGMCPDTFQNGDGVDLEEYVDIT